MVLKYHWQDQLSQNQIIFFDNWFRPNSLGLILNNHDFIKKL